MVTSGGTVRLVADDHHARRVTPLEQALQNVFQTVHGGENAVESPDGLDGKSGLHGLGWHHLHKELCPQP